MRRLFYRKDDPLRYLHVSKRRRLYTDTGDGSVAVDQESGDDTDFDRDEVRKRGGVVDESDLA